MKIACDTEDPVYAYIAYGQIIPGTEMIDWQMIYHTTSSSAHHVFDLVDLEPNAEHVYLVCASASSTWTNPSETEYRSFVTKTTDPSVEFRDLINRQGVASLSQIVVSASDSAYARFNPCGISKVELYVDGKQVTTCTQSTSGDHIECTFITTALGLTDGVHEVEAVAYDDYWRSSSIRITVLLDSSQGSSAFMARRGTNVARTSSTAARGVPGKQRYAQAAHMLSLKEARDGLNESIPDLTDDYHQQSRAIVVRDWLDGLLSGSDHVRLAKNNTVELNAVAWMILHYGEYKAGERLAKVKGRVPTGKGNHCNVALGDAAIEGNAFAHFSYTRGDWPTFRNDDGLHPAPAAILAHPRAKMRIAPLNVVHRVQYNAMGLDGPPRVEGLPGGPVFAARGWVEAKQRYKVEANGKKVAIDPTHGHCCLYVTDHIVLECRDDPGIWFGWWDGGPGNGSFYGGLYDNWTSWKVYQSQGIKGNKPELVWMKHLGK